MPLSAVTGIVESRKKSGEFVLLLYYYAGLLNGSRKKNS